MRVVITGGAGFLGQHLARALLARGHLVDGDGNEREIDELVLFDRAAPVAPDDARVRVVVGDVADAPCVADLIGEPTASVFHLAAVVSAAAEADFDLGMRVNLGGTRNVLEACRALARPPRLVFASSIATYGGELPEVVRDDTPQAPETSYGAQKVMGEILVNDMSRKGFVDGRSVRLPTIAVRPGKPNKAASTWVSSMVREPLSGVDVVCPVRPDSRMACLGPRRAVDAMIRVHDLPAAALGGRRSLLLPSISVTAGEIAEAVVRCAGDRPLGRILWEPDPDIQRIVDGWPRATRSARASALGIAADPDFDAIVRDFIESFIENDS